MDFGSYLPIILPLLAVPLILLAGRHLHPAAASWLTAAASVVLALGTAVSLALFTIAGLAGLSIVADLGHLSISALHKADVTDLPIDVTAATLLIAACLAATIATTRRIKALTKARRLAAQPAPFSPDAHVTDEEPRETASALACGAADNDPPTGTTCPADRTYPTHTTHPTDTTYPADSHDLLVLPDDRPIAHALPGRPGRIVVSTGMLASLDPAERDALLAHERAHLSRAHHLFVAVVDVFAAANPLLRPLRKVVRYTTERWADELAAREVHSRSVVAKAVGKAALATKNASNPDPITLAAATGEVPRRVAALLIAPPARRLLRVIASPTGILALTAIALTVGSAACAVEAARDLHQVLAIAHFVDDFPGRVDPLR